MSVISIETRKANELAATSNISDSSILMVHDGTGLKRITFEDVKRAMVYPNAGSHNSIYRGKYLGNSVSTAQYSAIRNGTFEDLFIGDYWTIGDIDYRIAAFDYYFNTGDTPCKVHHIVIVPDQCLYNSNMNDSSTTTGGYVGSKLYRNGLNDAKLTIENAFSNHILSIRLYLSNSMVNGKVSSRAWFDSKVNLLSEVMVYSSVSFSPMGDGMNNILNHKVEKSQLPLFALNHNCISNNNSWWLRDVTSSSEFANIYYMGNSNSTIANLQLGIRPYFCIS